MAYTPANIKTQGVYYLTGQGADGEPITHNFVRNDHPVVRLALASLEGPHVWPAAPIRTGPAVPPNEVATAFYQPAPWLLYL